MKHTPNESKHKVADLQTLGGGLDGCGEWSAERDPLVEWFQGRTDPGGDGVGWGGDGVRRGVCSCWAGLQLGGQKGSDWIGVGGGGTARLSSFG